MVSRDRAPKSPPGDPPRGTDAEAAQLDFTGSPTILIDGRDAFLDPDAVVGLSCRLYRSAEGASGAPSVEQLTAALAHADHG